MSQSVKYSLQEPTVCTLIVRSGSAETAKTVEELHTKKKIDGEPINRKATLLSIYKLFSSMIKDI
jgi:hypothetical protein